MHDPQSYGARALNAREGHKPLVDQSGGLVTYGKSRSPLWVFLLEAFGVIALCCLILVALAWRTGHLAG